MTQQQPDHIGQHDWARSLADNGKTGEQWRQNRKRTAIRAELVVLEQLADRIGFQCAAQIRLTEVAPGYQYDPDNLRVIRLAVNSMGEALDNIERLAHEVDLEEFGVPVQTRLASVSASYGSGLPDIESIANDIGVQTNAEWYVLGLVASRRRPNPQVVAVLRHLVNAMKAAIQ